MGSIFIFALLGFVCLAALAYPHVGMIGFLGFVFLMPEWNWRWDLPHDFEYQKIIAAATLIGFLLNGMKGNTFRGWEKCSCLCLVAFLGLAYLSSLFTINHEASSFYMENMWKVVLMTLIAYRLIDTPGKMIACLWVMTLAQGYNAFRLNEQYFQDGYSLYARSGWGTSGDNNLYSNLTVPFLALSGALVVYSRRWWQRCVAGGIFVLQLHEIMLLESRGAMLGGMVLVAVFVYLMPKNRFTVSALVLASITGSILAGPPVVREFASSFKGEKARDSSAESRFKLWKAGAQITADNPLLGVGPYAGQNLVPRYTGFRGEQKGLHNLVFEISTGCGIPATILYLAFFMIPATTAFRHMRRGRAQLPDWAAAAFLTVASGLAGHWMANMFSAGALLQGSYSVAALGLAANAILLRMSPANFSEGNMLIYRAAGDDYLAAYAD